MTSCRVLSPCWFSLGFVFKAWWLYLSHFIWHVRFISLGIYAPYVYVVLLVGCVLSPCMWALFRYLSDRRRGWWWWSRDSEQCLGSWRGLYMHIAQHSHEDIRVSTCVHFCLSEHVGPGLYIWFWVSLLTIFMGLFCPLDRLAFYTLHAYTCIWFASLFPLAGFKDIDRSYHYSIVALTNYIHAYMGFPT